MNDKLVSLTRTPHAHTTRLSHTRTPHAYLFYFNVLLLSSTIDSGVHSQQSLNKSVKIEILQPEVKDLLSTCAKYNLENAKNHDSRSAEILEEFLYVEAIENENQ